MNTRRKLLVFFYVFSDFAASFLTWLGLYYFRKFYIEKNGFDLYLPLHDNKFFEGLIIVPQFWLLVHYFTGTYTDLYRKSRLGELTKTAIVSLAGSVFIFFALLLNDLVKTYSDYYLTFAVLFSLQFILTIIGRAILLWIAKRNIESGKVHFNTLIVGCNPTAFDLYNDLTRKEKELGYHFIGYIETEESAVNVFSNKLQSLGTIQTMEKVVDENDVEEVIVAIDSTGHHQLNQIINLLAGKNLTIRINPDMYDILSGTVKVNHIIDEAMIEIPPQLLKEWEIITKRWFDIVASFFAIVLTSPFLFIIGVIIKCTSAGPIFYTQERIGQYGKTFRILKFRSMFTNAEQHGPALTSDDDKRITPIGKFLRKYRIDEFPQFINVLKGEMSIVGPRAERQFFADQIIQSAPHYKHVWKVKPGITSLGMVKYGYASTVHEMIKRLKYDIIYIENMSILMDFKIVAYTFMTVIKGRGK